ncbi:MAG: hypothetical protein RL213_1064 [Bacteroidota bacterium]|jgi:hypothetical protein
MSAHKHLAILLLFLLTAFHSYSRTADTLSSGSFAGRYRKVLILRPILTLEASKTRSPVIDLIEAELTAGLDEDLFNLLVFITDDSSRVLPRDLRDRKLYKKDGPYEVIVETTCDLLAPDVVFRTRYLFVNMPAPYVEEHDYTGEFTELRADFELFDCSTKTTVWRDSHSVYVPALTASYNELLDKMKLYIVRGFPEL